MIFFSSQLHFYYRKADGFRIYSVIKPVNRDDCFITFWVFDALNDFIFKFSGYPDLMKDCLTTLTSYIFTVKESILIKNLCNNRKGDGKTVDEEK